MRSITQRELRNDNAEVVRGVEAGETFLVTRRGLPVAQLGPVQDTRPPPVRPAAGRPVFADLPRVRAGQRTEEVLEDLRGER